MQWEQVSGRVSFTKVVKNSQQSNVSKSLNVQAVLRIE